MSSTNRIAYVVNGTKYRTLAGVPRVPEGDTLEIDGVTLLVGKGRNKVVKGVLDTEVDCVLVESAE